MTGLGLCVLLASPLAASGWTCEAVALFILCGTSSLVGVCIPDPCVAAGLKPCHFRAAPSAGVALGSCTPVMAITAIVAVRLRAAPPTQLSAVHRSTDAHFRAHFWSLLCCAIQPSLMLLFGRWRPRLRFVSVTAVCALATLVVLVATHPPGGDLGLAVVTLFAHACGLAAGLVAVKASFTLGEATCLAQGGAILIADAVLLTACAAERTTQLPVAWRPLCVPRGEEQATEALLTGGLGLTGGCAAVLTVVPSHVPPAARTALVAATVSIALGGVLLPWLADLVQMDGLAWMLHLTMQPGRPWLLAFWAAATGLTAGSAFLIAPAPATSTGATSVAHAELAAGEEALTRRKAQLLLARKVYHFLVVALFVPAQAAHAAFLQPCLAVAVVGFAFLELCRVGRLPPLAAPLTSFLGAFLDSRDGGTLVLTHVYLLLGCALPIWLDSALCTSLDAVYDPTPAAIAALTIAPYAGVITLGVGDAFASLVGVRCGRVHWPHSRKTLEGTAAGICAMLALSAALLLGVHGDVGSQLDLGAVVALAGCALLAGLLEVATDQIDNLFLPIFFHSCLLVVASGAPASRATTAR